MELSQRKKPILVLLKTEILESTQRPIVRNFINKEVSCNISQGDEQTADKIRNQRTLVFIELVPMVFVHKVVQVYKVIC